jgi:hypothetical protein
MKTQTVKVYTAHGKLVGYGELIGHSTDGKLLLAPRLDLANKPLSAIDMHRDQKAVRFLNVNHQQPITP